MKGPEVLLKDVRFSGRVETRQHLLKRLLGLRLGVPFSETETRKRIARFGADPLLTVRDWQIRRTDRDFWLDVSLQEQKANRVFGSAAWSAEYRELVGQFDLDLANLFGTRRRRKAQLAGQSGAAGLQLQLHRALAARHEHRCPCRRPAPAARHELCRYQSRAHRPGRIESGARARLRDRLGTDCRRSRNAVCPDLVGRQRTVGGQPRFARQSDPRRLG